MMGNQGGTAVTGKRREVSNPTRNKNTGTRNRHASHRSSIPVSHISIPDRESFPTPADVELLAESIQTYGLHNPIVVNETKGAYHIVEGLRRFVAVRDVLGYPEIQCHIQTDVPDSAGRILLRLSKNLLKRECSPLELASWLGELKEKTGWSNKRIALELGCSESWISKKFSLLTAPPSVQQAIADGELAETQYYNDKQGVEAMLRRSKVDSVVKPAYVTCKLSSRTADKIPRLLQQALGEQRQCATSCSKNISALIQRYADEIAENLCIYAKCCEHRRPPGEDDGNDS
jgi:ParB/RepB/Spo0J family partition protein